MITWTLEKRKLSELKDHPHNPRQLSKHDAHHLQASLERFGVIDKPVITHDGTIIGGHQRKKILKKLGYKEIECWVPDRELDPEEINELCIRLNKNVGDWNWDTLANEWEVTDLLSWGFEDKDFDIESNLEEELKIKENKDKLCPHCGEKI